METWVNKHHICDYSSDVLAPVVDWRPGKLACPLVRLFPDCMNRRLKLLKILISEVVNTITWPFNSLNWLCCNLFLRNLAVHVKTEVNNGDKVEGRNTFHQNWKRSSWYMRYSVPQYFQLCVYCCVFYSPVLFCVSMCLYPKALFFRVKLHIFRNSPSYRATLIYFSALHTLSMKSFIFLACFCEINDLL